MPRKLVVSIINYRTGPLTIACVESVLADMGDIDGEVVVIDNASGDGSDVLIAEWIENHPQQIPVRLIRSEENSGFSGGHNQVFAAVEAAYYLVLNSDAVLVPGLLSTLLERADATPKAGLIAPRLEDEDGTVQVSCFRFHRPATEFIRGACSGPVTRLLGRWNIPLGPDPDPARIEWASFACVLVRGQMISDIGPMDDGYFLYFEDVEFCLRARRAGWSLLYVPQARAIHHRGGSGPVKTLRKAHKQLPAYYWRSRARYFTHAYGRLGPWIANMSWHAGRGLAYMRWLTGRRPYSTVEREARDIWIGIRDPLAPFRPER
ncbi:MAG: glycosyltransferase family 2 protein [Pseudomonadota bacterium]